MNDAGLESLIAGAREEQRLAIRSLAPLTVVSAGAGTGKTQTLASRFAWLLASDPDCAVDQILTLTFTNAAASEMRERIGRTLREWRAAGVTRLDDAIDRLDEAYISTIHSFALRVIRESGMSLDIDPGSRVADAPTEREFWNDLKWRVDTGTLAQMTGAMPDRWRGLAEELAGDPFCGTFLRHYRSSGVIKLGGAACDMYGSMNLRPASLVDGSAGREEQARDRVRSILSPKWRDAWELWHDGIFPAMAERGFPSSRSKFDDAIAEFAGEWRACARSSEAEMEFFISLVGGALSNLPSRSALKEFIAGFTGDLRAWRDARREAAALSVTVADDFYDAQEAAVRDMLNGFAALFWERWDEARRERGVLSFSDFARYAAEALASDATYASRFRHIMIDEFQDTDELQDGIVRALSGAWPEDETPRTVFIVGDIKQSIYRFRHANPRLFAGYMSEGRGVSMSRSYRMSAALMESVNMVFGHVWANGVIKNLAPGVPYEPLLPPSDAPWWRERNGARAPERPVEILLYAPPKPEDGAAEAERESVSVQRRKLAGGVAKRLMEMMERGAEIWDKGLASFRRMAWGDVAVLVNARTSYPDMEAAFEEAGVPFAFDLSREYANRGEVRDLIAFVGALDRPDDERSLAGWIESPFSGLPQGASLGLVESARARGATLREELERAHPASASRLARLRGKARFLSPSRAVSALLEDDFWLAAYPERNRRRVTANIRRGVELLAEYEASCGRNLAACADYMRRELKSGDAMEEPGQPAGGDAVRVMTVHSSKGLEFPVVVLMFMESSRAGGSKSGSVFVSRSLGAVAGTLPDGGRSVRRAWHKAIEAEDESEESARKLYVAMTRAQDVLICCGLPERAAPDGSDWLSMVSAANEASGSPIPVTCVDGVVERRTAPASAAPDAEWLPPPAAWAGRPRAAMLSATAYALLTWCPMAYRIRYRQGRELRWERRGAGVGGADLGTLTHWVLSRWDFDPATLGDLLPDEVSPAQMEREMTDIPPGLRRVWRPRSNRASCRRWLDEFSRRASCDELRAALSAGTLMREAAFSVDCGGVNIVGDVDVFWEDEFGCHVRDWKITPEEDAPHEMYDAQVTFYAAACRVARPNAEVDAGLIYLRDPGSETAIRKIQNWDEITRSIQNAAEEAAAEDATRRGDCAACPFKSCCSSRVGG